MGCAASSQISETSNDDELYDLFAALRSKNRNKMFIQ